MRNNRSLKLLVACAIIAIMFALFIPKLMGAGTKAGAAMQDAKESQTVTVDPEDM